MQFQGINIVILYGITGPDHLDLFQSLDAAQHGDLGVQGKAGRHAVRVYFNSIGSFRFQKYLVPVLFRKSHHLVFYGWAIPCSNTFNYAGIHWRAVD